MSYLQSQNYAHAEHAWLSPPEDEPQFEYQEDYEDYLYQNEKDKEI